MTVMKVMGEFYPVKKTKAELKQEDDDKAAKQLARFSAIRTFYQPFVKDLSKAAIFTWVLDVLSKFTDKNISMERYHATHLLMFVADDMDFDAWQEVLFILSVGVHANPLYQDLPWLTYLGISLSIWACSPAGFNNSTPEQHRNDVKRTIDAFGEIMTRYAAGNNDWVQLYFVLSAMAMAAPPRGSWIVTHIELVMTAVLQFLYDRCKAMQEAAQDKRAMEYTKQLAKYQLRWFKSILSNTLFCMATVPCANSTILVKTLCKEEYTTSRMNYVDYLTQVGVPFSAKDLQEFIDLHNVERLHHVFEEGEVSCYCFNHSSAKLEALLEKEFQNKALRSAIQAHEKKSAAVDLLAKGWLEAFSFNGKHWYFSPY